MAKLIMPRFAYRPKTNRKAKWHIRKVFVHWEDDRDYIHLVCGLFGSGDRWEEKSIFKIPAENICKKCLGPIEAVEK